MLFIQEIILEYTKAVRNSNAANVRRAVRFVPVEFDRSNITDEILFNKVNLFQTPEGLKEQRNAVKIYGENALFTGRFSDFFGHRVFVKRTSASLSGRLSDSRDGYEILYTDKVQRGYIKSKFILTSGQSGRIVYNERYSNWDCPWLYFLFTFNFVCADKSDFKPKIFFNKNPDFTFKDMKPLRYNGY